MEKRKDEFLIGELAEICEVSAITLRYYDKIGILKPDRICSETNYRYYNKEKVLFVLMIKYYKRIGFTLKEINTLLNRNDLDKMQKNFTNKLREIEREMQRDRRKHEAICEWFQLINEGQNYLHQASDLNNSEVRILEIPKRQVVTSKIIIDADQSRNDFDMILINKQIVNTAEKYNLYCAGPVLLLYSSYNERMKETFNNIDIYVPIYTEPCPPDSIRYFGDFKAASIVHIGKYSDIHLSYSKAIRWCQENKINLEGTAIEKYLIEPWSTNNEQNYVTEIFLPILCD